MQRKMFLYMYYSYSAVERHITYRLLIKSYPILDWFSYFPCDSKAQTYEYRTRSTQCKREAGTQMEKAEGICRDRWPIGSTPIEKGRGKKGRGMDSRHFETFRDMKRDLKLLTSADITRKTCSRWVCTSISGMMS